MRSCLVFLMIFRFAIAKPIEESQLKYWDQVTEELLRDHSLYGGESNRLYAYLYVAQKSFADLSRGEGDIGPISSHVLKLFFKKYKPKEKFDPFSEKISAPLAKKIDERFKNENKHIHPLKIRLFKDSWEGKKPYFGIEAPTMFPWSLLASNQFRAKKPPGPENRSFWNDQLAQVKELMENIDEEGRKEVLYWDYGADWKRIGMYAIKNMDVISQIAIRATLAATIMDAFISTFDTKYAYLVRRPYQLDPQIHTLVPNPNHPTYTCAHCVVGAAAVTVLSACFPEKAGEWESELQKEGLSRIEAGLHFPIDIDAGMLQGRLVGKATLAKELGFRDSL